MYKKIKTILLRILPENFILKNEFLFRRIYSLIYFGNSVHCNICEKNFSKFIPYFNDDKLCPLCGSLSRDRRLWEIISNNLKIKKNDRILDFSPSRSLLKQLKRIYPNYVSTDFLPNFQVDKRYDISSLPEESNSFDWIVCYHVLEHIDDDIKAMSELFRVLKNNGKVIIQTPFKDGDIYEDSSITSPSDRLKHFGQEDHLRIYSVTGLEKRLKSVGFNVEILKYSEENTNKNGFNVNEIVVIAGK